MYKLMVSYDCGTQYHLEARADDPATFKDRCEELDAQMLRWVIEDNDGQIEDYCAIHSYLLPDESGEFG